MARKRKNYEDMTLEEKLRELKFQTKEDFRKLRRTFGIRRRTDIGRGEGLRI